MPGALFFAAIAAAISACSKNANPAGRRISPGVTRAMTLPGYVMEYRLLSY
jgi:hypothetical protein